MFGSSLFHPLIKSEKRAFEVFSSARKYIESIRVLVRNSHLWKKAVKWDGCSVEQSL